MRQRVLVQRRIDDRAAHRFGRRIGRGSGRGLGLDVSDHLVEQPVLRRVHLTGGRVRLVISRLARPINDRVEPGDHCARLVGLAAGLVDDLLDGDADPLGLRLDAAAVDGSGGFLLGLGLCDGHKTTSFFVVLSPDWQQLHSYITDQQSAVSII